MNGPLTPGMLTRNKARGLASPRPVSQEEILQGMASGTPKTRRQAQVFGTPVSIIRPALEDRTNESLAPPQPFGSVVKGASTTAPSAKAGTPKRSAAKGPRSGTPRAGQAAAVVPAEEAAAAARESPEASAEELLRLEVSRIMAGQPEVMETPVLAKRKVQSKIVVTPQAQKGGAAQEGGGATERVTGGGSAQGPSGSAEKETETEAGAKAASDSQRTLAGLCFSPTVFLAPTPANTPVTGVPPASQHQAPRHGLDNDAVMASLHALAAARGASESPATAAPGAASGALAGAGASGGIRPSASRARKPPMPRPTRGTPKASAHLAAIRIATPIGKTPPPRVLLPQGSSKNEPAHPLSEEITSPASSPERPTRALTFDSPPANRSLPSSPTQGSRRSAVPPSPAWSLDVNISTPAVGHGQAGVDEAYHLEGIEDREWEEGEEGEAGEYEHWEGGEEGEHGVGEEDYGYDGENEFDDDAEEDMCEGLSGLSVSGRSVTLRGLPPPAGTHIHFEDEED